MRIGLGGAITVTATERWLSEIRAGRGFTGGALQASSVGNFSEVQLLNPAGSAVTVLVRAAFGSLSGTARVQVRTFNTALATLVTAGVNLLAGGAAGTATVRRATPAAADGTLIGELHLLGNTPIQIVPEWYFELGAAEGLVVVPDLVNIGASAFFHWIEL